jgi:hypothetical protein
MTERSKYDAMLEGSDHVDQLLLDVHVLSAIAGTATVSALATLAACYFFLLLPAGITLPIPNVWGVVILLVPVLGQPDLL